MQYIIMCGGVYEGWEMPRQLTKIGSEAIVERTIRLLKEAGVKDIAISSNHPAFEQFGVPVLHHENNYVANDFNTSWVDGFYLTDEPVCYLFGDVVFSPEAIKTIVKVETDSVQFFASSPPFADNYIKPYAEPFAFKVVDTEYFARCIAEFRRYRKAKLFKRWEPISWELWQIIKNTPINRIDYTNYYAINDYTCDIDHASDVELFKAKGVF